jgi:hypothetical protein
MAKITGMNQGSGQSGFTQINNRLNVGQELKGLYHKFQTPSSRIKYSPD